MKNGTISSFSWLSILTKSLFTTNRPTSKISRKGSEEMFSVIVYNKIMIGPLLSIRTVGKSMKKWLKMIGKRKRKNNCGVICFPSRTITLLRTKKHSSRCFKKSTQWKRIKKYFQESRSLIEHHIRNLSSITTITKEFIKWENKNKFHNKNISILCK